MSGLTGSPVNGTLGQDAGTNIIHFDPKPNFVGIASFTYHSSDPSGAFTVGTVTINVVEPST